MVQGSNAGDEGSIPGRGTKIPCAMGQLSPFATTRENSHTTIGDQKIKPKKQNPQTHRYRGVGKMGGGSKKVQISSYKINKSGGCYIQHGDYR